MYLALPDLFKRRSRIRDKTGTFFFMSFLVVSVVLDVITMYGVA